MNKIISIIAILGILIVAGCTKEEDPKNVESLGLPIASFSYSGNEGPAPVTVQFNNTSEYCDQYEWTFHNGAKSNEFAPSFTYNNTTGEDQNFLVILKVTDGPTGETNTRSKSVLIRPSK